MGIRNSDDDEQNLAAVSSLEILLKSYEIIKGRSSCRRRRRLMKRRMNNHRRRSIIRSRDPEIIQSKVKTLKKLIPNCESMGDCETLLKEAAEYIMDLQVKVKLMQVMVDVLSTADHDLDDE